MKKISKLFAMILFACSLSIGVCSCSSSADYDTDDAEQMSVNDDGRSIESCIRYSE
ncbi:MAG: hypothetical protein IJ828_10535 [Treponema sp.]|nr:hypothetical protein [Treponema sp.]